MTDTPAPDPTEALIERLAKEIERVTVADYGWTDEQFEIWWTKDPAFVQRVCGRAGAPQPMTRKEHALWQIREGLKNAGLVLSPKPKADEIQVFAMHDDRIADRGDTIDYYDILVRAAGEDGEIIEVEEIESLTEDEMNAQVPFLEAKYGLVAEHVGG